MDISQRIEQFVNADYPPNETDVSFAFDLLEDCKKEIQNLQAQNEHYRELLTKSDIKFPLPPYAAGQGFVYDGEKFIAHYACPEGYMILLHNCKILEAKNERYRVALLTIVKERSLVSALEIAQQALTGETK